MTAPFSTLRDNFLNMCDSIGCFSTRFRLSFETGWQFLPARFGVDIVDETS